VHGRLHLGVIPVEVGLFGGDGALRQFTFLAPLSLSVLTQHRTIAPFGLDGGMPGACGRQRIIRTDESTVDLRSIDAHEVSVGDRLILETPGGGGYGSH